MTKKNTIMKAAKEQVGVGVASMGGMAAIGAMAPLSPHSGAVVQATSAGLGLANVGQMVKGAKDIGQSLTPGKKKKTGNKVVDNILG